MTAWIGTVAEDEATGIVREHYEAGIRRAGRVFNILKVSSLRPDVMDAWIRYYVALMGGESSLSRAQREMIAVVVSSLYHCEY